MNAAVGHWHTVWLMDSGASEHITPDMNDFTSYEPFEKPLSFGTTADGLNIHGLGEGTV